MKLSSQALILLCWFSFLGLPSALTARTIKTTFDNNLTSHPTDIHGLWIESKKKKLAVWIEDCGRTLCGRIYWMKNPLDHQGHPKLDTHNPDKKLRNRTHCGLKIFSGFVKDKFNSWEKGIIYNPKNGSTYRSKMHLSKDGILKVRGYIGLSLFGKTLKWKRPEKQLLPCKL